MPGQLIRMFLADGIAEGIKTLEISNKTVFCTIFPRPMYEQFKSRKENNRPGVYILVGEDVLNENEKIYIGEGDPVGPRLASHYGNKDFWTDAIVFTSKDDYLTKTQIQYIESKLIQLAHACGQVEMDSGNVPQLPNISEVDEAEVNAFLDSILLLIKALGYDFFQPLSARNEETSNEANTIFEYVGSKNGIKARMQIRNGKYVLLKGSMLVRKERPSASDWVKNNRKKLKDKGLLNELDEEFYQLNDDTEFRSASGAAAVVVGGNMNGLTTWKYNGQTLADFEKKMNKSDS